MVKTDIHGIHTHIGLKYHRQDLSFYRRILASFSEEYHDAEHQVRELIDHDKTEEANRYAHSLKSLAASIGATNLSDRARDLELALAEGRFKPELVDALAVAFSEVRLGLAKLLELMRDDDLCE